MSESQILEAIRMALAPSRFVARDPLRLSWDEVPHEELFWEVYQGRLLGASMTRERKTFRAWNVRGILDEKVNDEPFVSIKQAIDDATLFVTRGLLCHGHRAVAVGNVIETAEDLVWSRELVGVVDPRRCTVDSLRRELTHLVFSAVVGSSQLPLTSLEAPLPDFSLGRLGYLLEERDANSPNDASRFAAKHLEFLLRSRLPVGAVADRWPGQDVLTTLRSVFLGVSLSPYTAFVSRSFALLRECEARGTIRLEQRIDFLGWLIRLQWRHLNAYDLFLFHHRGANYPDALLVDEAQRELLACAAANPNSFVGDSARLRRRALRCGWFLRAIYEGHRVPRQPTSPGENTRVLPAPWEHVSEEEILNPYRRPRELFREPLILPHDLQALLFESTHELRLEDELRDLGTALILDRPLGWSKSIGEPDLTPMLAYVARSRKLALRHIEHLKNRGAPFFRSDFADELRGQIEHLDMPGVPMPRLKRPARPGVLSLTDAFQTSDDFALDRTARRSCANFRGRFDWSRVGDQAKDARNWRLILPVIEQGREVIHVFNEQLTPWLRIEADATAGFQTRDGVELPTNGLRATVLPDGSTVEVPRL